MSTTPVSAASPRARSAQVGVHVPRRVRDLPAPVAATAVALYSRRRGDRVVAGYSDLHPGTGRPDATARHLQALVDAGIVARVGRVNRGSGRTEWRLLVIPGGDERYDVAPWPLVKAYRAGKVTAGAVLTWLHVDQALGWVGHTRDAAAELAARVGVSTKTIARHLRTLATLGVMRLREWVDGWLLERHTGPQTPVEAPVAVSASPVRERPPEAPQAPPPDRVATTPLEQDTDAELLDTNAWSTDKIAWSHTQLAPDPLTPEKASSSPLSGERHLGDTRGPQRRRKAPKKGVFARSDVWAVLDALGAGWAGDQRRWLGGVASSVAAMLDHGMSVPAATQALRAHADPDEHGGRLIPAAKAALSLIRRETRQGLACADCGHDDRPIVNGQCEPCRAPGHDTTQASDPATTEDDLPVEIRARFCHHLGLTLEEAEQLHPDIREAEYVWAAA